MSILNFELDDHNSIRNTDLYGQPLSIRELQIIKLIATQGMSRKQIAIILNVSEHTIRNQTVSIFDKLNIDNNIKIAIVYLNNEIPSNMITAVSQD